jgi:hypothetical protein
MNGTKFIYGYIQYQGNIIKSQIRYGGINNDDKGGFDVCLKIDLNYYSFFGDDKLRINNFQNIEDKINKITVYVPSLKDYKTFNFVRDY